MIQHLVSFAIADEFEFVLTSEFFFLFLYLQAQYEFLYKALVDYSESENA